MIRAAAPLRHAGLCASPGSERAAADALKAEAWRGPRESAVAKGTPAAGSPLGAGSRTRLFRYHQGYISCTAGFTLGNESAFPLPSPWQGEQRATCARGGRAPPGEWERAPFLGP